MWYTETDITDALRDFGLVQMAADLWVDIQSNTSRQVLLLPDGIIITSTLAAVGSLPEDVVETRGEGEPGLGMLDDAVQRHIQELLDHAKAYEALGNMLSVDRLVN